jgi:hypothetical protein
MIESHALQSGTFAFLPRTGPARKVAIAILLLAPFGFGAFAIYLGQSVSWDFRNYHWYNAYAYATGRTASGMDFLPSQVQFFLNPWLDLPFYWLANWLPPRAAFFILGTIQGLNFPLLFLLAHVTLVIQNPFQKIAACSSIALIGMLGAMGISELGTTFNDNITSLGVLLSTLLLLSRIDYVLCARWQAAAAFAILSGLPLGLMTGLKLTAAIFCPGLCLALLLSTQLSKRGFFLGFFFGLGILIGSAATYGHWGWFLYTHFQNPVFPLFNGIFGSPYIPPINVRDFSAQKNPVTQLLYPFLFLLHPHLVSEVEWRDWRGVILYALMIAVGVFRLLRPSALIWGSSVRTVPAVFLLSAVAISYVVWLSTETIYRYLLPLEMLSPLLIVVCLNLLPLAREMRIVATATITFALIFLLQPGDWGRRHEWSQRIVEIDRPSLPDSPDIMILMAGIESYAYLLSEFPPHISVLRLESRAFHPASAWGINDLIRARIDAHKGQFMLLMPATNMDEAIFPLKFFGLKYIPKTCRNVIDRLAEKPGGDVTPDYAPLYRTYKLCNVVRLAEN